MGGKKKEYRERGGSGTGVISTCKRRLNFNMWHALRTETCECIAVYGCLGVGVCARSQHSWKVGKKFVCL